MENSESSADRSPSPSYPVSAAGNALRVVRLLHELDELRVMDVADRLGVARSTAHRILAMLVFEGFAAQDRHKVYRPGPALQAIRKPCGPSPGPDHHRAAPPATAGGRRG